MFLKVFSLILLELCGIKENNKKLRAFAQNTLTSLFYNLKEICIIKTVFFSPLRIFI